jgi:hypothetical protein
MTFFTIEEFNNEYNINLPNDELWKIKKACEMIYSQVGLRYRNPNWDSTSCPQAIKDASMEQLRFILEYDIPSLDVRGNIKAGAMESDLKTDYSLDALRILANHGYMYRGNPINHNMGMTIPFGE